MSQQRDDNFLKKVAVNLALTISGNHQEHLTFLVISSPSSPLVLGLPWLKLHNQHIDWVAFSVVTVKQQAPAIMQNAKVLLRDQLSTRGRSHSVPSVLRPLVPPGKKGSPWMDNPLCSLAEFTSVWLLCPLWASGL